MKFTEGGNFVSQTNSGTMDVHYDEQKRQWEFYYESPSYRYHFETAEDFSLIYYYGVYTDPDFIQYIKGFSEKEIILKNDGSYLLRFKRNTPVWRERKIPDIGWAVLSETTMLYFQMVLPDILNEQTENPELTCFMPPYPTAQMAYTVEHVRSGDLQTETEIFNDIPDFFREFQAADTEIILIEGTLTGLAQVIHPFPFYFAYQTVPPYRPIAIWGGIPNQEDYFAVYENE